MRASAISNIHNFIHIPITQCPTLIALPSAGALGLLLTAHGLGACIGTKVHVFVGCSDGNGEVQYRDHYKVAKAGTRRLSVEEWHELPDEARCTALAIDMM